MGTRLARGVSTPSDHMAPGAHRLARLSARYEVAATGGEYSRASFVGGEIASDMVEEGLIERRQEPEAEIDDSDEDEASEARDSHSLREEAVEEEV